LLRCVFLVYDQSLRWWRTLAWTHRSPDEVVLLSRPAELDAQLLFRWVERRLGRGCVLVVSTFYLDRGSPNVRAMMLR
jgi:hypothetical protein